MISENISHDSIVFYKVMDNSENIINMQFGKPGWYSMFKFRDYDKNGILDEEIKKLSTEQLRLLLGILRFSTRMIQREINEREPVIK